MKTTLNKIRAYSPCESGWKKLLANLGKTKADDEPLALSTILESNGLDYAIWCLRAVEGHEKQMRLFAVACARQVQHLMTDQRSLTALDVAERFANGQATKEELEHAEAAAWDADVGTTEDATEDAAGAAARAAAWAATDAVRSTVWDAAGDAAWAAAWVAEDAARKAQSDLFVLMCECAFD